MKFPVLLISSFCVTALWAQPDGTNAAAGDPVASVQSGSWMEVSTWDCDCIPSENSDVAIQAGHNVHVASGDTATASALVLSDGAGLSLPAGAVLELFASLSTLKAIEGEGVVGFVGEGSKVCGPASLEHLACGAQEVTFTDTVKISSQLDLETSQLETGGMLVLLGESGITSEGGTITGPLTRRYTWVKESVYTQNIGVGLDHCVAQDFLSMPGAIYLKEWVEPSTGYGDFVPADTLPEGKGFRFAIPMGTHDFAFRGEAALQKQVSLTAEASNSTWKGWNLLANPLTSFVDLNSVQVASEEAMGAVYVWIDSLQTFGAQIAGFGNFGFSGLVGPGQAFWTIADTNAQLEFDESVMVTKADFLNREPVLGNKSLGLQLNAAMRREHCRIQFAEGDVNYNRLEDAIFSTGFQGRNDLDIYSKSADDVSLMVNRTAAVEGVIPIWVKALIGDSVTISATEVPQNVCLTLEDIETGWTGTVNNGLDYTFQVNSSTHNHRFNLIVGGGVEAIATGTACASAADGTISVVGPDASSTFTLVDAEGDAAGFFTSDSLGGTFTGLQAGTYTVTAISDGCPNLIGTVEVASEGGNTAAFSIEAMPDHIGCYDDHGGVSLQIEGGLEPYTVSWDHGDSGSEIEVDEAGVLHAVITDAAGCSDSTTVEVLAAPQVSAGIQVENPVVALMDGEAEVYFDNTSIGATGYQWNFGDGGTSTSENPIHGYTEAGAYTVGLNAWNDYCSDTYQMVITVETVSSVGDFGNGVSPILSRTMQGWEVNHPHEAFTVEVFDLTGRVVFQASGMADEPVALDPAELPVVALVHWVGALSGQEKTWRIAR